MSKQGLELILDVVEAARVRILSFDAIETPTQAATATHIADLLVQGLVETKRLMDVQPRLSSLSNEKGSRRIQLAAFVPGSGIEIRESNDVTLGETSTFFVGVGGTLASCAQLEADQLFGLAKAILSWFGFEPKPAPDHPDFGAPTADVTQIVEWIRESARKLRNEHDVLARRDGTVIRCAALEARADDYDGLANQLEAGAWKVKP